MKQKRMLFLGYDAEQTALIGVVRNKSWAVEHASEKIADLSAYDLVVSFGYRHILPENVLKSSRRSVLNLHVGYLPYNRGAHPNFWSFCDHTPAGVTIHEMDTGVDTGPIVFQRHVKFSKEEDTFSATYQRLITEAEALFVEKLEWILSGKYEAFPQLGRGTSHLAKDLPKMMKSWDQSIQSTLSALEADRRTKHQRDMELVDRIQATRTRNNVNWMDLLRIALTCSPGETKEVLKKINSDDNAIAELLRQLGE